MPCILCRHQRVNSHPLTLYHPEYGEYSQDSYICYCAIYFNIILKDAQILCTMSLWQITIVRWCLTFVDSQYETWFMSPFWRLQFWVGFYFLGQIVHLSIFQSASNAKNWVFFFRFSDQTFMKISRITVKFILWIN
jgi:hypothetical protein